MTTQQPDVLIVGAGPTGLTAALLLGRAGVRTHVVTKHHGTVTHPRAHLVNARTMELFRQWGLADPVSRAALPPERGMGMGWMTRMAGSELGRIMVDDDPEALTAMLEHSGEIPRSCPQDVVEPLLRAAAEAVPGVTVESGTEAVAVEQDPAGVTTRVRSVDDGAERAIRSSYVIGADGARSRVRDLLGVPAPRTQSSGQVIGVHFHADLTAHQRDRPFLLWWVVNPETQGAFIAVDGRRRWVYLFGHDPAVGAPEHFTPELCAGIVRQAVGDPEVPVDVRDVSPWWMETAIAERFRDRRVFLAGDAAHRFPPTGGFGMNTGIQDAHNLAWKLGYVLRGTAGEALLDTYEAERRPVALANARRSAANAEGMRATGVPLTDPDDLRVVEDEASPRGAALRARLAAAIPEQRDHVLSAGQVFGYVYDSAAVIDDGTPVPASTVSLYRPTAHPGARAPHLWLLSPSGERKALVDLTGDGFSVLTGPEGRAWQDAVAEVRLRLGTDICVLRIGPGCPWTDETGRWQELYGIGPSGCVLVRPDGHVAMRRPAGAAGAPGVLARAMAQVLVRE